MPTHINIRNETENNIAIEPPKKRIRMYALSSDSEDEPLIPQPTHSKAVLQCYKAEPQTELEDCPLEWWKSHAGAYPVLTTMAKKYLSSSATTVPFELLFSLSRHKC